MLKLTTKLTPGHSASLPRFASHTYTERAYPSNVDTVPGSCGSCSLQSCQVLSFLEPCRLQSLQSRVSATSRLKCGLGREHPGRNVKANPSSFAWPKWPQIASLVYFRSSSGNSRNNRRRYAVPSEGRQAKRSGEYFEPQAPHCCSSSRAVERGVAKTELLLPAGKKP